VLSFQLQIPSHHRINSLLASEDVGSVEVSAGATSFVDVSAGSSDSCSASVIPAPVKLWKAPPNPDATNEMAEETVDGGLGGAVYTLFTNLPEGSVLGCI